MNDNRNYHYSISSKTVREEYSVIVNWVKTGSHVIDMGCGDGSLLRLLNDVKNVTGVGTDSSESAITAARKKGVSAQVGKIDTRLPFKDKHFDYAICNVTLQMVMYPETLLYEMMRISKRQIISFPNFAFILNRLELLTRGRMPKRMLGGYQWYSTGHAHQLSIADFIQYCQDQNIKIVRRYFIYPRPLTSLSACIPYLFANLFSTLAIFQAGN